MKKLLFLGGIFVMISTALVAQTDSTKFNLTSKRGFYYFPEKGDWSLSISATPFLDYIGNIIGNKTVNNHYEDSYGHRYTHSYNDMQNSPEFAFTAQNPGTIYFKYFNRDNRAYRVKLLFGYSHKKDKLGSGDEEPHDISLTQKALAIGLTVGQEFYRPIKSRIRGYYGYEVGVSYMPFVGSTYSPSNINVTGNVKYENSFMPSLSYEEKGGNTFGINGAGILGAEWFFAPKISLGGEFGLGFKYAKQNERTYSTDINKVVVDSGGSRFNFEPYASGDLILHIYF